jgi:hypothetical protein
MVSPGRPLGAPAPLLIRSADFAVGRRVFIAGAGDRSAHVTLTDDADRSRASWKLGG